MCDYHQDAGGRVGAAGGGLSGSERDRSSAAGGGLSGSERDRSAALRLVLRELAHDAKVRQVSAGLLLLDRRRRSPSTYRCRRTGCRGEKLIHKWLDGTARCSSTTQRLSAGLYSSVEGGRIRVRAPNLALMSRDDRPPSVHAVLMLSRRKIQESQQSRPPPPVVK
jgi:hypothetical protein